MRIQHPVLLCPFCASRQVARQGQYRTLKFCTRYYVCSQCHTPFDTIEYF